MARTSSNSFLTFRVDEQLYALPTEQVSEVIRLPAVARVPQAPPALIGIANLRGSVLPVAGLRELLGKKAAEGLDSTPRALILDIGAPIALVVDSVETLENATAAQIETRQTELGASGAEKLLGAFPTGPDKHVAKILDIKGLLEAAFTKRARGQRQESKLSISTRLDKKETADRRTTEVLVTFEVAGQEFALPLDVVQEILPAPSQITAVAREDKVVLGIVSVRDALIPLLSLRGLLGFEPAPDENDREKVVVVKLGNSHIGLLADRARAIVAADVALVDPVPPILAARTGGESRIRSVYRGEGGRRLISILAPEELFREDVMKRLSAGHELQARPGGLENTTPKQELIFLVFRLGNDEFGLPIDTVVEVAQVPSRITRVPRAPKFLEGVINLRGEVLPVVDQRRRFEMPQLQATEGRRLVVIKTERHRAGLIVDGVSDVLRTYAENIERPPDLTEATTRLVRGVVNLEKSGRIVLLLDPTELLTRAEQGLLDTFQAASNKADA